MIVGYEVGGDYLFTLQLDQKISFIRITNCKHTRIRSNLNVMHV